MPYYIKFAHMLPKGLLREYSRAISIVIRGMDMFMVFIAGTAAYYLRFGVFDMPTDYLSAVLIGVLLTTPVFSSVEIYHSMRGQSFIRHVFNLIQALCTLGFLLAGLSFFTKSGDEFSRTWFLHLDESGVSY